MKTAYVVGGLIVAAVGGVAIWKLATDQGSRSDCQRRMVESVSAQDIERIASRRITNEGNPHAILTKTLTEAGCARLLNPFEESGSSDDYDRFTDPVIPERIVLPGFAAAIARAIDLGAVTNQEAREIAQVVIKWARSSWEAVGVRNTTIVQWLNDSGIMQFNSARPRPTGGR